MLSLSELVAPTVQGFKNQSIIEDKNPNYVLQCNVLGNPAPIVSWKFNDVVISTMIEVESRCSQLTPGQYYLHKASHKLVLCKVDFTKHAGKYTCVAKNKVSTAEDSMYLHIEGNNAAV